MEVALAVLYRKDKRYADGRKPIAFPFKNDLLRYVRYNRSDIFEDQVLVILRGGASISPSLNDVCEMNWMRDESTPIHPDL